MTNVFTEGSGGIRPTTSGTRPHESVLESLLGPGQVAAPPMTQSWPASAAGCAACREQAAVGPFLWTETNVIYHRAT
jgi:hypothetical protein